MMVDQQDIDNLVSAFNDSFLANFFPNLEGAAGQQLLESVAEYVISCHDEVLRYCPKIWLEFAIHKIALILTGWGITIGTDTINIQTPSVDSSVHTFLKSRKIGEKTCTFEQVKGGQEVSSASGAWKMKADSLYNKCMMARTDLTIGGGSNWPDCYDDCGCDDTHKRAKSCP